MLTFFTASFSYMKESFIVNIAIIVFRDRPSKTFYITSLSLRAYFEDLYFVVVSNITIQHLFALVIKPHNFILFTQINFYIKLSGFVNICCFSILIISIKYIFSICLVGFYSRLEKSLSFNYCTQIIKFVLLLKTLKHVIGDVVLSKYYCV